ncbi:hypothetical protein PsYK624_080330 [Phanerochaete sordida]|uniref:Uncharacterized protein n=1 Tax=Phanerochaete sordida TaxID=48140 RepID=A0A9P3G9T5_9APHY|nr:hypothetical protein PsYK624_080330 [Phanerochaete sordida]
MLKIHLAGLSLGELDAEHFLLSDAGEVRIVNFGRANVHKCHAKKELDVQAWEPKQQDYDCNELYLLMQEFELWTPGSFTFLNSEWPIFSYPTYEHLVEFYFRCPPHHPAMIEEVEEFAQEAREALDRFYAQYEERFPLIGDPRMIKPKAGNDSNTASSPSLGRRLQQFFSSAR